MNSGCILFSSYLPPIQFFSKFLLFDQVLIEQWENFPKQTYRNRCYIYSANGPLCLPIPIRHSHTGHTPIKNVQISYESNWQKIHWRSIETAYRCSPFFEFYEDELRPFYEDQSNSSLFDFNLSLISTLLRLLKINQKIYFTGAYQKEAPDMLDYRSTIHPKGSKSLPDNNFHPEPYQQVFENKHGFLPNLSIVDLLFNEGPHCREYLETCIK